MSNNVIFNYLYRYDFLAISVLIDTPLPFPMLFLQTVPTHAGALSEDIWHCPYSSR